MTTTDPERLAEMLELLAKHGYVRGANSDLYEAARILRTLKPSERGPTNDEIEEEALARFAKEPPIKAELERATVFGRHCIEATRDQSWFKPESKVDEADKYRLMLLELLAVIHRDGGHKTQEIGVKLAWQQAMEIVPEALTKRPRVDVPEEHLEAMRRQGQDEGFASAISWLRDRSAQKPAAYLAVEADILANGLENSRKAYVSLSQETSHDD